MKEYPAAFLKAPHSKGCRGELVRAQPYAHEPVHVDRKGRIGNGGINTHDYVCNTRHWTGCPARVLVTEAAVRQLAVATEVRP